MWHSEGHMLTVNGHVAVILTWLAFEAPTFFVFINLCISKGLQGLLFLALNCHPNLWAFIEPPCVNAVDLGAVRNQIEMELNWWRLLLFFFYYCMWQKIKFKQIRTKLSQIEECLWLQTWCDPGSNNIIGAWCVSLLLCLHFLYSGLAQFVPVSSDSSSPSQVHVLGKSERTLESSRTHSGLSETNAPNPTDETKGTGLMISLREVGSSPKGLCWEGWSPSERS